MNKKHTILLSLLGGVTISAPITCLTSCNSSDPESANTVKLTLTSSKNMGRQDDGSYIHQIKFSANRKIDTSTDKITLSFENKQGDWEYEGTGVYALLSFGTSYFVEDMYVMPLSHRITGSSKTWTWTFDLKATVTFEKDGVKETSIQRFTNLTYIGKMGES